MTLSSTNKAGLALAGLLGVTDIASYFLTPAPGPNVPGPPQSVLILGLVLGIITVVTVAVAFRSASRPAIIATIATRVISALTAVPAFLVDGVPTNFQVMAAVFVAATIVSVGLIVSKRASA